MMTPALRRTDPARRQWHRWMRAAAMALGLLAFAACGADPTPPPVTAPVVATQVAASPMPIISARVNGDDPLIVVKNVSADQSDISGWTLLLGTSQVVLPANPGLRIYPTLNVNVHLSTGGDSSIDVYVGSPPPGVLNSLTSGEKIALVDPSGQVASVYQLP